MTSTLELSYRIAAVDTGSPIGMLLALYDTLSGNLHRAAAALRAHDIEGRCSELSHAYMVLGQLESWIAPERDAKLSDSLALFYAYLRAQMLDASLKQSASSLDALVQLVLQVRSTWQQHETTLLQNNALSVTGKQSLLYDASSQPATTVRIALSHSA